MTFLKKNLQFVLFFSWSFYSYGTNYIQSVFYSGFFFSGNENLIAFIKLLSFSWFSFLLPQTPPQSPNDREYALKAH